MLRTMRKAEAVLAVIVSIATALLALAPTALAVPTSIAPGYDLFQTDPGTTQFDFAPGDTAIPQDFFGPGSDPFAGTVKFGGVPLNAFNGTGNADTIIHRPNAANPPSAANVPIEIVALNLVSVQPITVTYNSNTSHETWNVQVDVSPSLPSTGHINIVWNTSGSGGTFDAQLRVIPRFTFVRLPDGAARQLDAGILGPTTLNRLILSATGIPWRNGCKLPALAVPVLSTHFCPGQTPGGRLADTHLQAQLVDHDIYPVQPRLEHFRCYSLQAKPFAARQVTLTDQFRTRAAQITSRKELCNPVQKNAEPFLNTKAHLVCYATTGSALNVDVQVQNQFGTQQLHVGKPVRLCLPSRKRLASQSTLPQITVPIDHFQCYAVQPVGDIGTTNPVSNINLTDQFTQETVQLGPPFQLCAPVKKNQTASRHPVEHLVCYGITQTAISRQVVIKNQFEAPGLQTVKSLSLCLPSNKIVLAP